LAIGMPSGALIIQKYQPFMGKKNAKDEDKK
jgi:hypothetical protein